MHDWLKAALDYVPRWLDYQMRETEQPGCSVAVAFKGRVVLEQAFGYADASKRKALTPGHRFRAASHSKSFAAAGVLKLREANRVRLDDPVGRYIEDLHRDVAEVTLAQLLSHSAGLIRDGKDAGQFVDRRPFLNEQELRAELAEPPVLDGSTRFKYSNHGFGLLGLVIESVTGEPYCEWIQREVMGAAKLEDTHADGPVPKGVPLARGHSGKLPLGRRVVVPGNNVTNAMAPATGVVSTARDLARFFAGLDPAAKRSVLSTASRREMVRRQWRDDHSSMERHYGLGVMIGRVGDWDWFGHNGAFQGTASRTVVLPGRDISVSLLTNTGDGYAYFWADSVIHILRAFAKGGAPLARTRDWTGRWWSLWGAADLVPMRDHVAVAIPAFLNPFMDASEITVTGRDRGLIRLAGGLASHGEGARLVRDRNGRVREVWLGGSKLLSEGRAKAELKRKYGG